MSSTFCAHFENAWSLYTTYHWSDSALVGFGSSLQADARCDYG